LCCRLLQCVAAVATVWQCHVVARVLRAEVAVCVAVCCSMLHRVATVGQCSVVARVLMVCSWPHHAVGVAVCCSVLHRVATVW